MNQTTPDADGGTPTSASAACCDTLEAVQARYGDDFALLADLYRKDSPPRLAALRHAHQAGEHAQVARIAHAFAGSCASIGATSLCALCREVELRAKAGTLQDFDCRMTAIEAEYRRIDDKLRALLG